MGSGPEDHDGLAEPVGRLVAELGANLLTGGGRGVMATVSRAFCATPGRLGHSIAVLPAREDDPLCAPRPGYPNPWVEIAIRTHLPLSSDRGTEVLSRNHINVLSSDAVVALPGGAGTASETRLALRYERPLLAFLGVGGEIDGLAPGVPIARSIREVEDFLRSVL